eukprot:5555722-Pyramimonas_sp.AAC.1
MATSRQSFPKDFGEIPRKGTDVAEVYSRPRVTQRCVQRGLQPGSAMDLAAGFDFALDIGRRMAREIIEKEQPLLIALSPPRMVRSRIGDLSNDKRDQGVVSSEERDGLQHLEFCAALAREQREGGGLFQFGQPACARSRGA